MLKVTEKQWCCGCTACETVCPHDVISMENDTLGFPYPVIDQDKCTDCGLCVKTCDFTFRIHNPLGQNNHAEVYAVRHKDEQEVATSQSGAASVVLYDWIFEHDGVAYGAGYGSHFRVEHKRVASKAESLELKGSKYVQSMMGDCFADAERDLKAGRYVLFTGVGCQIAGLLSYLKMKRVDTTRLITCDLICHGVPSPRMWEDYLTYVETKKLKKPVVHVDFRDKKHYGWKSHKESFYTTYTTYTTYTYIFYDHVAFREACGNCPYASTNRLADFTVCDFWGYEKVVPEMGDDDKGLSLMFVSSPKAQSLFSQVKEKLHYKQVNIADCLQPNMLAPSVLNINRGQFEKDYIEHGFEYVMKKYGRKPLRVRVKSLVRRCIEIAFGKNGVVFVKKVLGKTA